MRPDDPFLAHAAARHGLEPAALREPRADLGRAAPKPRFALGPAREDYHRPMSLDSELEKCCQTF